MKKNDYQKIIFVLITLSYLVPLLVLFNNFSMTVGFVLRLFGILAFVNTFVQIMTGSLRNVFKKIFNPVRIYWFHNYMGVITLVFALIHALSRAPIYGLMNILLLNTNLSGNIGMIALYLMILTVFTSDLKYFFKIKYNHTLWRIIHLLNYIMFFLIYVHASMLGTEFNNVLMIVTANTYLVLVVLGFSYRIYTSIIKKYLLS